MPVKSSGFNFLYIDAKMEAWPLKGNDPKAFKF